MKGKRNEHGNDVVITSEEIKVILDRYRIGKKPLAKLLGWGETTIIRYMDGDIPTKEYSNKLKLLLDDPEYYYYLLINRKDQLTNVAYRKSKRAVLSKIMSSKIYAVAYHLVNKSEADICPSYVQFLLYYAQAFSLALNDSELFQDEYAVNSENMPYPKLYENMKRCGIHTIDLHEDYLSPEEIRLIDEVFECFTWYGPKALYELMAFEKSILKISRDKYNNKVIAKDTIKEYFKDILVHYNITNYKEICKYPEKRLRDIRDAEIII
jgi:hypothetical protein